MPVYEFRCLGCENEFEKLMKAEDRNDLVECPVCGTQSQRLMSTFTAKMHFAGATSPKALGSDADFRPTSKKQWHQAVGRNHGRG